MSHYSWSHNAVDVTVVPLCIYVNVLTCLEQTMAQEAFSYCHRVSVVKFEGTTPKNQCGWKPLKGKKLFLFHIYCICHSVDMALLLSCEKKLKCKGTLCSEIKTQSMR